MKHEQGFSLIELLIVVAVLLVLAAIAIPNLLRSRVAANEASAVGSLHALNNAELTFSTTYPNAGYACTLAALGPPASGAAASSGAAGLIDANLASGLEERVQLRSGHLRHGAQIRVSVISGPPIRSLPAQLARGTSVPTAA